MTVQPNGTHAKEIALHFLKLANQPVTKTTVARTIKQAKSLLDEGYSRDEVFTVMERVFEVRKVNIHSFGYITSCMEQVLDDMRAAKQAVHIKAASDEAIFKQRNEVETHDQSTERNRSKADRTKFQSRLGKKYDFDMFEEQ